MASPSSCHVFGLHKITLALAAGVLGFAANGWAVPVFGGTSLIFGGFFSLLATICLGPICGTIAAAIAFSRTIFEWQHGAGFACYTLESVACGWLLWRRGWRPINAVAIYWLCIGLPLVASLILGFSEMPFPGTWAIVIKYPVNSLIVVLAVLPVSQWIGQAKPELAPPASSHALSLRRMLFERFGVLASLPIVVLSLLTGKQFDEARLHDAMSDLSQSMSRASQLVAAHLGEHRRMIETVASQISSDVDPTPDELHEELEAVRTRFPGFLTLLIADDKGAILATAVPPDWPTAPGGGTGTIIADRDYFRQPVATGRSYVSDVFQGRGLGHDLIVAISAPIFDPTGRIRFVVEGSLDLHAIFDSIAQSGIQTERDLVISDRRNNVVVGRGEFASLKPLQSFAGTPLYFAARESAVSVFPSVEWNGRAGRYERYLASYATVPEFEWHVYLQEPIWRSQRAIALFYFSTLLWAALAVGLALLLARQTASAVTQPLTSLLEATSQLAQQGPVTPELITAGAPFEIAQLSGDVHAAALRLRQAAHEREQANAQLQELNRSLDAKVLERTAELQDARLAAESASQSKSEFLASMSHELRTPLNVILGMTELLAEQHLGPMTDTQRDCLRSVDESARHLLSLINDVLDLSKIEAAKMHVETQPVRITDVCDASLRMIREIAHKKNLSFTSDYRQTADQVQADPRRLKQMLVNLLSNAAKFTPEGGQGGLIVTQTSQPPMIVFTVWDTGIGITAENISRLFQPFVQIDSALSRRYNGTGLGLALVKRMAVIQGGDVTVESTPGKGSRFSLSLPAVIEAQTPEERLAAPATLPRETQPIVPIPGTPLILIAEDNTANIALIRYFAQMHACRTTVANNGIEAIARARVDRPDIILMDVNMPDMDGLEATRIISTDPQTRHIPIICLTANAMPEDRDRCLSAGAQAYLSKPVDLHELAQTITRLLPPPPAPNS